MQEKVGKFKNYVDYIRSQDDDGRNTIRSKMMMIMIIEFGW